MYSRATGALPDLGRGTVYATLAEFAEVGLLASFGTPEPVRYETNTTRHAHFRCRICLRVFDVAAPDLDPDTFARDGHEVETLDFRAEGICSQCQEFEAGVRTGVRAVLRSGASAQLTAENAAAVVIASPLGPLLVAATEAGIARVAFSEHGDAAFLTSLADEDAPPAIAAHLARAERELARYFSGKLSTPECTVDWDVVGSELALRAVLDIPSGSVRSYDQLGTGEKPRALGRIYGANPVPLFTPCHRVSRGSTAPDSFVGGPERREWLLEHERR